MRGRDLHQAEELLEQAVQQPDTCTLGLDSQSWWMMEEEM
jgi:hypothetical protein